ncbi:MAG: GntR family transcriptional regulator [Bacteroidota bacterium]
MQELDYIRINVASRVPKYKQIADSIISGINKGDLKMGDQIPSINALSERYDLSRDTVDKAYRLLKEQNVILSVRGKGFYISKTNLSIKVDVLFLVNKLSTYKMRIYNAFVHALGANAHVDLHIYHCEPSVFIDILKKRQTQYNYFVIMPHFRNDALQHMGCTEEILQTIRTLPEDRLIIMDRNLESFSKEVGRVYQDFTEDIYNALLAGIEKIKKYQKIILVYPQKSVYPYPHGIVIGFKRFCVRNQFDFEILDTIYDNMEFQIKDLYIIISEEDLVNLVQQTRDRHYKLGEDIGIISYNDTPLKALLGITVISTDFQKMGVEAASMIIENKRLNIKNDFKFIDRNSI